VDEADRDRVQEVQLFPAAPLGDDEAGLFELPEMLHHPEAGHREPLLKRAQRLPVGPEQLIEQLPPRGVSQRLEHLVHAFENR